MNNLIDDLINILEEETRIYNEILSISKDKTSVIVEGKVNELEKIVKLEQSFILHLAKLEDKREDVVDKLKSVMGLKNEDVTVSNLLEYTEGVRKEKLELLQDTMTETVDNLRSANKLNSKLIKNSLDYINFSLELFTGMGSENNNYDPRAGKTAKKAINLLDVKI